MTATATVTIPTSARLAFELPDFTRAPAWVSAAARDIWQPRVSAIAAAWSQVERASVGRTRRAALVFAGADELPALRTYCDARRLMLLPVGIEGASAGPYAASSTSYVAGSSWRMRAIICEPDAGAEMQRAYFDSDELTIGKLLGYPACCSRFYRRVWVDERWRDTTWPMAIGTAGMMHRVQTSTPTVPEHEQHPDRCSDRDRIVAEWLVLDAPAPACNILLRWLGVRLVPHLPCSFRCGETVIAGEQLAALAREMGYAQEIEWLTEMLSWPVEWSALHGIAEIKTPALKFAARTDASAHKWAVQLHGPAYPEHGASGVVFPYRVLPKLAVTGSRSFAAAITHEPAAAPASRDNGFPTPAAEQLAHATVLRAADTLRARPGRVLDLGCGNGKLVAELCAGRGDRTPCGVELMPAIAAKAAARLGADNVVHGSLVNRWPGAAPYGVLVVMPGRLIEIVNIELRERVTARILQSGAHLLLYAYGDWLARSPAGLQGLVADVFGDRVQLGEIVRGDGVEAAAGVPISGVAMG